MCVKLKLRFIIYNMLFFKTKIQKSNIEGSGLFAEENIPKKSIVFIFLISKNSKTISEEKFNESWKRKKPTQKDLIIRRSGVRYIRSIFLYCIKNERKTLFFNHSNRPNILYHCGIGFAKFDIKAGEELTIDYKYFDTNQSDNFINIETGKKVEKYESDYLLKKSTKELLDILNS